MAVQDDLAKAKEQLGGTAEMSLVKKSGRLKSPASETASDVLGFDVTCTANDVCYEYYAANPPLIGLTQPVPVPYPLGLAIFDDYKINYQQAVDIFHSGNWGSKFTSIVLDKPLHPDVKDPFWYMMSDTGVHVAINANTGQASVQ